MRLCIIIDKIITLVYNKKNKIIIMMPICLHDINVINVLAKIIMIILKTTE